MSRDYRLYTDEIIESIHRIKEYTKDITFEDFIKNKLILDAVLRNFEIIGEAIKNIPEELLKKYPSIDWKGIKGFRDIVAHRYFSLQLELIWDLIINKLDELEEIAIQILGDLNKKTKAD